MDFWITHHLLGKIRSSSEVREGTIIYKGEELVV